MPATYSFLLNDQPVQVEAEPKDSVLDVFREKLGVLTMKGGCAPQGLCGCCTALVDGKPRLTCTLPVKSLEGKSVTTLEGIGAPERERVAAAFAAVGAAQCGYCTPGIALSTCAMLAANANPSDDDFHRALAPHTCRCTGYGAILDGMRLAAACARGEQALEKPIGEAGELVLGLRPFVDDLVRPGVVHGVVVFAPVASGRVVSLDAEAAQTADGVVAVHLLRPVGSVVRHAGDVVALVAAESLAEARAAAAKVVVAVEAEEWASIEVARGRRVDGDVTSALAGCSARAEVNLQFSPTDAVPLEPEAALAVPSSAGLVVYSSGHDAARIRASIEEFGVQPSEVVLVPSGGSYGAKAVPLLEPLAALLADKLGRPARVSLDHADATRLRPRRPGAQATGSIGGRNGEITAIKLEIVFDGGAIAHDADRLVAQALGALAYDVEHLELVVRVTEGAGFPTGPVRGAGIIPVVCAVEALIEQLAVAMNVDGLALRSKHAAGAAPVLQALAEKRESWPGISGLSLARSEAEPPVVVELRIESAEEIRVRTNVPELGQGRDAALLAALVQETGLEIGTFAIDWVPASALASGGPVDEAARIAGRALAAGGGALAAVIGREFQGESRADAGFVAHLARLDAEGGLAGVDVVVAVGVQDVLAAINVGEGAAAMGAGVALSEEVASQGGLPENRFRYLGTFKSKLSPKVEASSVVIEGGCRDVAEAAVASCAAVLSAVSKFEGKVRERLPMKDSAAARSVGVRVR